MFIGLRATHSAQRVGGPSSAGLRASLLAAAAPLALHAAPASGACIGGPQNNFFGCVNTTVTLDGDHYDYTYTFTSGTSAVNRIEIPEVAAGVFSNSGGVWAGTIPDGWELSEQPTTAFTTGHPPGFAGSSLSPGAFLEIVTGGGEGLLWPFDANGGGNTFTLSLQSPYGNTIDGYFLVQNPVVGGEGVAIDPPTPNPVPEPSTLALLGAAMAGVAGLRRRRPA